MVEGVDGGTDFAMGFSSFFGASSLTGATSTSILLFSTCFVGTESTATVAEGAGSDFVDCADSTLFEGVVTVEVASTVVFEAFGDDFEVVLGGEADFLG